jgi:hypothetical protein
MPLCFPVPDSLSTQSAQNHVRFLRWWHKSSAAANPEPVFGGRKYAVLVK